MTLRVRFGSDYCIVLRHKRHTEIWAQESAREGGKQIKVDKRQHKREGGRFMSEVGGKEDRIRLV